MVEGKFRNFWPLQQNMRSSVLSPAPTGFQSRRMQTSEHSHARAQFFSELVELAGS